MKLGMILLFYRVPLHYNHYTTIKLDIRFQFHIPVFTLFMFIATRERKLFIWTNILKIRKLDYLHCTIY